MGARDETDAAIDKYCNTMETVRELKHVLRAIADVLKDAALTDDWDTVLYVAHQLKRRSMP